VSVPRVVLNMTPPTHKLTTSAGQAAELLSPGMDVQFCSECASSFMQEGMLPYTSGTSSQVLLINQWCYLIHRFVFTHNSK